MESSDRKAFVESFKALCLVYEKEPGAALVEIYFRALQRFEIDEVKAAVNRAVIELKWFPKPVELIELAAGRNGSLDDRAMAQALLVASTIRQVGAYRSVSFEDPVTGAVIQRMYGTWPKLCDLREYDVKWFIKDFVTAYRACATQKIVLFGYLPGIIEINNEANGYPNRSEVVRVGLNSGRTEIGAEHSKLTANSRA